MTRIMCLHQVYPPPASVISYPIDGRGNCQICVPDEKNKECIGYRPMMATIFFIGKRQCLQDSGNSHGRKVID